MILPRMMLARLAQAPRHFLERESTARYYKLSKVELLRLLTRTFLLRQSIQAPSSRIFATSRLLTGSYRLRVRLRGARKETPDGVKTMTEWQCTEGGEMGNIYCSGSEEQCKVVC
jgi:hypothetical protein